VEETPSVVPHFDGEELAEAELFAYQLIVTPDIVLSDATKVSFVVYSFLSNWNNLGYLSLVVFFFMSSYLVFLIYLKFVLIGIYCQSPQ